MGNILLNEYRDHPAAAVAQPPDSVSAVEEILNYKFRDKGLLVKALTHPSSSAAPITDPENYNRLEFVGDAVLQLAFSNYLYMQNPPLDPGYLTQLRAANVSTERLARVAVKHQLYKFVSRNSPHLDHLVREFEYAVKQEDTGPLVYGGSVKAPKVLADIIESIAAAVYVDVGMNLESLWKIFKGILEPIVTVEDIKSQPQPITKLYQLCQKQGKIEKKEGPPHDKKFVSAVEVNTPDGKIPRRQHSNNAENRGVAFPKTQPMRIYSSLWNADDWATRGGLVKTDWSKAPFTAYYRNFRVTPLSSSSASGSFGNGDWQSKNELDANSRRRLRWVQNYFMIYNYCTDSKRFPQGLPTECK
ncbi:Ribonuclease 3-like protein 2 [Linum perenne]